MNRIPLWGIECLREGFHLLSYYDIYLGQDIIGKARVKAEGMFFRFECQCRIPSESIHYAIVQCGEKEFNLGVCIPEGNSYLAYKRIPIKEFKNEELRFFVQEKKEKNTVRVSVNPQKPFAYLQHLDHAKLDFSDENPQILLDDPKCPNQGQQDSDQSQEFHCQ